ncbi:protein phosphatase [Pseudomonas sp. NPDC098740]|uniref:protein phosphatase n=1 Tax=Pseudomonas sp. NPDC098740 TaxID=3364486 RepID=UPI00383B1D73
MPQHPYSVLPLTQFSGQLIFTPCPGTKGTKPFDAVQTLKDAGAPALRPRAIQHPAHIEYIGQFDKQSNSH